VPDRSPVDRHLFPTTKGKAVSISGLERTDLGKPIGLDGGAHQSPTSTKTVRPGCVKQLTALVRAAKLLTGIGPAQRDSAHGWRRGIEATPE